MAEIRIAAILRAEIFSPNHIANDAAILHAVVSQLRRRGCAVNIYSESEFCDKYSDEDVILAMCRGEKALEKTQALEDEGKIVVNSGYGIENCVRMIMVRLLADAGIAIPESIVVETDVNVKKKLEKSDFGSCWVKKGDAPVHHQEDIARCRHPEEAQEILHEFFFRHIKKAVVSKDIPGEKIRFYGIASTGWFYCFMPYRTESIPAEEQDHADQILNKGKEICMNAAEALRVDIFGGDMVVTADGDCYIMNFDDWPSFAPIRKEASKEIAKSVMNRVRKLRPSVISKRKRK